MKKYLQKLGHAAYRASLYKVETKIKNKVLLKFSYLLKKNASKILRQNNKDIKFAKIKNINKNLITRLEINKTKLNSITVSYTHLTLPTNQCV